MNTSNYYPDNYDLKQWLPGTKKEIGLLGWDQPDIILFSGDAYIDHPAFGASVIGRVLEEAGFKVALVPQPNWQDDLRDFTKLGSPRLFFGVTAGNMDSMINHYTANKRLRSNDAYSIGGKSGFRPDRTVEVYAAILRRLFPDQLIIAGGIEASLRRLAHYDYWKDAIMPSLLASGNIDYLFYGNAERSIVEFARTIDSQSPVEKIRRIHQIAFLSDLSDPLPELEGRGTFPLFSYEEATRDASKHARNFRRIEEESNVLLADRLIQEHGDRLVVVNPPGLPANTEEMDRWHGLPYTRLPHPRYWKKPLIPAFEMIRFSINMHRGCFGGCSFCTISAHQGKHISSRSEASILEEVAHVSQMPGFKGYISDLGGPSANMYRMEPIERKKCLKCRRPSCVWPALCRNINISHQPLLDIYRKVRNMPGIKKAFVGSGIRYDLFQNERARDDRSLRHYPEELIRHHVSGRLKVAPEHTESHVLKMMRKPGFDQYLEFGKLFRSVNKKHLLNQELIPYFISSHPGCSLGDMAELAAKTRESGLQLEQVQDFTPTPMTLATTMYCTGLDPYTLRPVEVARNSQGAGLARYRVAIAPVLGDEKLLQARKTL
ncbi:MAG: YgiQ family radical SAM protein, partial [Bacteroidales bacterium]